MVHIGLAHWRMFVFFLKKILSFSCGFEAVMLGAKNVNELCWNWGDA